MRDRRSKYEFGENLLTSAIVCFVASSAEYGSVRLTDIMTSTQLRGLDSISWPGDCTPTRRNMESMSQMPKN